MPSDVAKSGFRQAVRYIWRRFDTARGRFKDDSDRLRATRRHTELSDAATGQCVSRVLAPVELARRAVPTPRFGREARHTQLAVRVARRVDAVLGAPRSGPARAAARRG